MERQTLDAFDVERHGFARSDDAPRRVAHRVHVRIRDRAQHALAAGHVLIDSYHCSRYNTQTRRLTDAMFRAVFDDIAAHFAAR